MSSFTLTNTATEIDSAISRVVSAETEPTSGSQNMVTSGGVKAAIDSLSTGGITASSLGDNLDTEITNDATDLLIPSSKAVVDYVTDTYFSVTSAAVLDTGIKYSTTTSPQWTSYRNIGTLPAGGYMVNFQLRHCVVAYGAYGSGTGNAALVQVQAGDVTLISGSLPITGNRSRSSFTFLAPSQNYAFKYIPADVSLQYRISIQGNTVEYPSTQVKDLQVNFINIAPRP